MHENPILGVLFLVSFEPIDGQLNESPLPLTLIKRIHTSAGSIDSPTDLYNEPGSPFTAAFAGVTQESCVAGARRLAWRVVLEGSFYGLPRTAGLPGACDESSRTRQ